MLCFKLAYSIIVRLMLGFLFTDPLQFLIWAAALVSAVTVHEFAHAWTAVRLGDPTPKLQGRLTLNPLAHLDPLGTLMLLLVRFGWGKPVVFDPYNLKNPRRDAAVISLAGPAANLLLASILSVLLRIATSPFSAQYLLAHRDATKVDLFMSKYGIFILILLVFPIFGTSFVFSIISPVINFLLKIYIPGTSLS